jgi:hypothetical protein
LWRPFLKIKGGDQRQKGKEMFSIIGTIVNGIVIGEKKSGFGVKGGLVSTMFAASFKQLWTEAIAMSTTNRVVLKYNGEKVQMDVWEGKGFFPMVI